MAALGMLTAEDQKAIEELLREFIKKSESEWAAIVDKGGNLFAQHGNTGSLDLSVLSALAAGSFSATHELAKRLGESEFSALYHEGQGMRILMGALACECLLVTIFAEKTNIGLVRFYAQQVTGYLNLLLKQAQEREASSEPLKFEGDFLGDSTIS